MLIGKVVYTTNRRSFNCFEWIRQFRLYMEVCFSVAYYLFHFAFVVFAFYNDAVPRSHVKITGCRLSQFQSVINDVMILRLLRTS